MEETIVEKKSKRIFWIRFSIYVLFGLIIPLAFLIWRFKLFSTTDKITFGGWGVVATIILAVFIINLSKQAENSVEKLIEKQVIRAIRKVLIPLLTVTLCFWSVSEFVDEFIQLFALLTICETISYIANPMFELVEKHKEDKEENKMIKMAKIFWSNK